MVKSRLTDIRVKKLHESGKYYDGNGLFLQVYASGAKCWQQRITIKGRRRTRGLGGYPRVTLKEAREKALENLRLVRSGEDPWTRGLRSAVPTFREAAEKVIVIRRPTWTEPTRERTWRNSLARYVFPMIGDRPVSDITRKDLLDILSPIWNDKPEAAKQVHERIGVVMRWAVGAGYVESSPAGKVIAEALGPRRRRTHHKAVPYLEIGGVVAAIRASDARSVVKLVIEFVILTAARSGEARGARWDEMDLESAIPTWVVPEERMKARREHRVPLSSGALTVLERARAHDDGSGLVFPAGNGRILDAGVLSRLLVKLDIAGVLHGFRSTFRDWCGDTGVARELAEECLAHQVGGETEAAYRRERALELRRRFMEDWAQYIATGAGPVSPEPHDGEASVGRRSVARRGCGRATPPRRSRDTQPAPQSNLFDFEG